MHRPHGQPKRATLASRFIDSIKTKFAAAREAVAQHNIEQKAQVKLNRAGRRHRARMFFWNRANRGGVMPGRRRAASYRNRYSHVLSSYYAQENLKRRPMGMVAA